jgi:hypothetical protein
MHLNPSPHNNKLFKSNYTNEGGTAWEDNVDRMGKLRQGRGKGSQCKKYTRIMNFIQIHISKTHGDKERRK